jgi:type IV pilus assembly protein PilM
MPNLNPSLQDLGARLRGLAPQLSLGRSRQRGAAQRPVTGLDIEPGQVVAVQVQVNGGLRVERAAGLPIQSDVVRDGEVADVEALTEALRTVFTQHKLPRDVRVGIANQRIMVRTLEFPPITDPRELDAAVRFKAQDEIPMPPDTVVLDYQSLGVVDTMSGPRQRVVLVAARRDMIERLLTAVHGAGLRPQGIDLAGFALIRALHQPGSDADRSVLYLHVSGLTNMVVARGVSCVFTRVLGTGLEAIATGVAERCGITIDEARRLVFRVGLLDAEQVTGSAVPAAESPEHSPRELDAAAPGQTTIEASNHFGPEDAPVSPDAALDPDEDAGLVPDEDAALSETSRDWVAEPATEVSHVADAAPGPHVSPAELEQIATARMAVADGVRLIVAEVRNSLDYHRSSGPDRAVERVVLSGPAIGVPGLLDALSSELSLPVSPGEVAVANSNGLAGVPANRLAVAAGLAVSEVAP